MNELPPDLDPNAVAVVGMACKFGPATSADRLWELLREGRTGIRRHTPAQLVALGHDPEIVRRDDFVPAGAVLEDADAFDAEFFGYSAQHAEWLDPQQRLLLETAWHALEDAGFAPDRTGLRTAAYVSVGQPTLPPVGITELDAAGMIRFSSADKDFAATRVSYKLGLTGPSMTVQTACSSALVALHLAAEALLGEECELAVVAAASLHFPQAGYLAAPGMILSPSGTCRPFDDRADGTLFGNGGGALVLRRLADALADGDPVRAVLRGSAVNNDGARKMDYHAPSPEGQEAVLREALAVAGVDPHSVGLLETHGTGTHLGDPVEFAALERVYGGDRPHPAAVGSVKSVVGHLNTAAGIAGVVKAVLALEHGTVPRQVPFDTPNTALGGTGGLRVADASVAEAGWPVPEGPRRAAVSSFGIGGTNAHVVLEQAPAAAGPAEAAGDAPDRAPRWAVLSAHTDTALRELAGTLADAVEPLSLPDVVHTLREGRSHRRTRIVVGATTTGELRDQLRKFAADGRIDAARVPDAYRAWAAGEGPLPAPEDEPRTPRRVRLPGYPFARVHRPRPGAALVRTVRPDEPLAADHVVAGRPVLPAAAQLDLALTAVRRAGTDTARLTDIAFHRPVEVTGTVTLSAAVADGAVTVASDVTHTEARITAAGPATVGRIDLAALRAAHPDRAQPADLYRWFADHGVSYGPAFQVLRELCHGQDGALARVQAPQTPADGDTVSPYVLDGALQTVIGCVLREDLAGETFIPFAVDALTLHAGLPQEVWVHIRPLPLAGRGRRVRKYDVTVADPEGHVVLTLTGLALRPVPRPDAVASRELPPDVHLFAPATVPFTAAGGGRSGRTGKPAGTDEAPPGPVVVIGDAPVDDPALVLDDPPDPEAATATGAELVRRLGDGTAPPVVVWPITASARGTADAGLRMLALLRALLRPLARRGAKVIVPYPDNPLDDAAAVTGAGIAALGRSLAGENPRFELTALALDTGAGPAALARAVRRPAPASRRLAVGDDGTASTTALRPLPVPAAHREPFRRGGRYWINGMGALAALLADHLLDRYAAHVVLTGRSAADGERAAELARLTARAERSGGSVRYHRLDATDAEAVRDRAGRLRAEGPVHGVLHCAGVLRDAYVLRKETADAADVIAAKLTAAVALDEATAHWPLDSFVVYSSVSGALGSPGQADYAYANAAADALVTLRARRARAGLRHGRSLSVGWPYWADGGMRTGGDAEQVLGTWGMRPMPGATGLAVLETLLAADDDAGHPAPVVLHGDRQRLLESFPLLRADPAAPLPAAAGSAPAAPSPAPPAPAPAPGPGPAAPPPAPGTRDGAAALAERLRAVVSEATRTPLKDVTEERPFDDLGIDSLLAVRVVEMLEADFGRLSKTLLFECRTVAELAEHLTEEFPERCAALTGSGRPAGPEPTPAPEPPASATAPLPSAQALREPPARPPSPAGEADPRAVAVIGVAGRFPQADGLDQLWSNLLAGRDSITEVPRDRWDADALYDPDKSRVGRTYTKWGGFVDGVETFDAPLFSISPREAGTVDPQARLFLEACWAAVENAGYTPDRLVTGGDAVHRKDVGVFVGAMYGEYQLHEAEERLRGNPVLANSAYWSIANRVSYFFDFQGPSTAVDTACSSALTALHLAVESLRAGSSKVAIAGGVNVLIHPNKYFMLGQGRFASSDGRCRSFGAGGDGYVPGEGVGAFVLKPLPDALRDGDHIHAVIRGTAANHGGRTNGYTVPNPRAQADLVTKALRDAGLTAADLDYVETHGTGTALGDPIEIRGLTTAFARDGVKGPGELPIGSVKSNVGHLESAAGAVALAKVLLQLRHRTLVPSLHATPANPEIDFGRVPFTVQRGVTPWATRDGTERPLRAGISSFGAGGGNAHVVVEGPPPAPPRPAPRPRPVVVFLSARSPAALAATARDLRAFLLAARERGEEPALTDVAFTLAAGRVDLAHRAAMAAGSPDTLLDGLAAVAEGRPLPRTGAAADDPVRQWLEGGRVDRVAVCGAGPDARRVPLPHYPFERVRCWYDLQIGHLHRQGLGSASHEPRLSRPHLRDFGRPQRGPGTTGTRGTAPQRDAAPAAGPAPASPPKAEPQERPSMTPDRKISLRPLAAPAPAQAPSPTAGATVPAAPAPSTVPPAVSPPARADDVLAVQVADGVREVLAGVLYTEPGELDTGQTFQTLGVDSILSVEFVALVNARYGTDVKATELYDHPTPDAFARHVAAQLSGGAPQRPLSEQAVPSPAPVPAQAATPSGSPAPVPAAAPSGSPAPVPVPAGGDRVEAVLDALREQLAETLYCDLHDVDPGASFSSLGLDSILGAEFVAFVNNAYGLKEKAGVLYDHPSPRALAAHIAARTAPAAPPPPASAAPGVAAAELDALLAAVRDNRLTVEQALQLLPQHG